MSMIREFSIAAFVSLTAAGCVWVEEAEEEPSPAVSLRDADPELEEAACPRYRQIARMSPTETACPVVSGWAVAEVFEDGPGELREYCRYRWTDPKTPANVEALENTEGLLEIASDCEVVFEQTGDAIWEEVGPEIVDLFHYGIGWASPADLRLVNTESERTLTAVAVVDSVPEPAPANPRSEHGEQMVSIINDIACPAGTATCAVQVERALGLPRYGVGKVGPVRGGFYGSQADIARAIYDAVESWKDQTWPDGRPNLVINLSFAWEGELFGDKVPQAMQPAVDAVYSAIEYATCHPGVVVIAAAGNQGYPCTTGPLLPGGWEQRPAPNSSRCAALGLTTSPSGSGYKPLLYSVGGLDHHGGPMPGTREDGRPRLAALADGIAGTDSTALVGTSVSSAVASGAAALIWSYAPGLSPSALMAIIYQSGNPTSVPADYYGPNAPNTQIRSIDVCAALKAACQLTSCPPMPLGCLTAAPPLTVDDLVDDVAALVPDYTVPADFDPTPHNCSAECSAAEGYFASDRVGIDPSPCPDPIDQTLPYTLPQPTQIGCPNCTIKVPDAMVEASLDPAFAGKTVERVIIGVSDGSQATYFSFGSLPLGVTTITEIELDPTLMPATVAAAKISIHFTGDDRPIDDPLLIGY